MNNFWLKIKVWIKLLLAALILIYVIVFVAQNSAKPVTPWFWYHTEPQTSLLLLVLYAFLAGMVCTFLTGTAFRTIRQFREMQHHQRLEKLARTQTDQERKAAMLRSRPPAEQEH